MSILVIISIIGMILIAILMIMLLLSGIKVLFKAAFYVLLFILLILGLFWCIDNVFSLTLLADTFNWFISIF